LGQSAAGILVVGLVAFAWSRRETYAPVDVGRPAPDYAAADLAGDTIQLTALRGKVVLLNVWATWCRPCVKEMPALERLHQTMSPSGLAIIGVSVDNAALSMGDPGEAVRGFVREYGITFPIVLDPDNRIEHKYQVPGMPMTYLIDRAGIVRGKFLGPREWDQPDFVAEIRRLLEMES
jgi:peroxiredoxin